MAENKKKSMAQKAASSAKPKKSTAKASPRKNTKDTQKDRQAVDISLPGRYLGAFIALGAFILLAVMAVNPQGALISILNGVVLGLIGKAGSYVAILACLYLFVILAFSGTRPVKMRCICVGVFVMLCGCISHLVLAPRMPEAPGQFLLLLYQGGSTGLTGGFVCGLLAEGLKWLCGTVVSYIFLVIGGILTLLGAMQITIPSVIRAIENRPRAQWEEEEEEKEEPAAVVVNTIAQKRIAHLEQKRIRKAQIIEEESRPEAPAKKKSKAAELIRELEADVSSPVVSETETGAVAAPAVEEKPHPKTSGNISTPEPVPAKMPDFDTEDRGESVGETLPAPIPAPTPEQVEAATKQKVTAREARESAALVAAEIAMAETEPIPEYVFPPIDLLKLPNRNSADGTAEMRENSRRLNETLQSFKIEAHIVNVTRGPSVTRYEVELQKGVRLSKLTSAADDIALSLGASGVRIAAVPDKISVVGIEVPNKTVTTVSLREVIDSPEFSKARSKSAFAVGKDIGGKCIVGNIAKLPHMLIAGTTGSGKSVCMNSIIISLLYKASPQDVKLIMVDPKMVELGIYNGIPHLLIPVVTDPKKAAGSLQWAVTEMLRRYKAMSDAGVRDLESYNLMVEGGEIEGEKLPQVVVIIDELADLMLVAAKEVEESICRIAQMGRASGIHLVIATQRPSADVITGLMKANIPSRIAFAVASAMESRIILDTQGAEKLVGKGDMLFAPIGTGKPQRVQGCFVTDPEVEAVANFVKNSFETKYDESVMEEIERKAAQTGNSKSAASDPTPSQEELEGDEMLPQAVDVILEIGQASVSMLQRRLKLGYARAARIMDEMEEKGIVGPYQGAKPRNILVTKEQWEAMRSGQTTQLAFDDLEADLNSVSEEMD